MRKAVATTIGGAFALLLFWPVMLAQWLGEDVDSFFVSIGLLTFSAVCTATWWGFLVYSVAK